MEKPKNKTTTKPIDPVSFIKFKNNSDRLKKEFRELEESNLLLYNLILDCAEFCQDNFKKNTIITMIQRTQEEQDVLYRDNPKYQQKKFKSPHQFGHAVDLRSRIYTSDEINKLVEYLNNKYNPINYYKFTALCHNVGSGDHFHIQLVRK